MAAYSYRTVDLRSNAVLEDVDLRGVNFTSVLNGQGSLDGNLFVPPTTKGRLLDSATTPGRTGLYVLRDQQPVWGGIIWKRQWSEQNHTFRLTCASWESYAYHTVQRIDKAYTSTDQIWIGVDLIQQSNPSIQSQTGIEPPTAFSSGVFRQRYMYGFEFNSVGHELELLSGLQNSFDYRVQSYFKTDGSFGRRYIFGYPRLGASANVNDPNSLTFDYPGNLLPFEVSEDAESAAWRIWSVGSGEADKMLWAVAKDAIFDTNGWPMLDRVTQYKSVELQPTLQAHANEDLINALPPIQSWTFSLAPDSDVTINDFSVGDSAVFRLNSRRWVAPYIFVARIHDITVRPPDPGQLEQVSIGLDSPVIGQDVTDPESQPDPTITQSS